MARRVEGYWDCTYCGAQGIGGLTKTCPKCGHPQAKGLKFYVKKGPQNYLEPEVAKNYGKGADWVCAFCGSYNRYNDVVCRNCGAEKADSEENYFGKNVVKRPKESYTPKQYNTYRNEDEAEEEKQEESKQIKYEEAEVTKPVDETEEDDEWVYNMTETSDNSSDRKKKTLEKQSSSPYEESSDDYKKSHNSRTNSQEKSSFFEVIGDLVSSINIRSILAVGGGIVLIASLIMLFVAIFSPKEYDATISDKSWDKSISIQELKTFNESDWDIPYGARVYDRRREIRSYQPVIDHYEKEEYTVSHQEIDYYDVEYHDNGDGTFDEERVPVYKTVYETKERDVPVYVNVPVYDTRYYYEIDRWCYERTAKSSGKTDEPYWPEFTLHSKERESSRSESYTIYMETEEKTYSSNISYEKWKEYDIGEKVHITVVAGIVTEIVVDE